MSDQATRQASKVVAKRKQGVALMLTVLLLIAVSGLALSTMQKVASDGTVAGFQNQEQMAFYAAEAGVAAAREVVRGMGGTNEVPTYPADFPNPANPILLANPGDFEAGAQPVYFADPTFADPIGNVGKGAKCREGCGITTGKGASFFHTKWQINVVGRSPSGDQKRLEVVATRLLAGGSY